MPWSNKNHGKVLVIKSSLCRKSNSKKLLHHVPNGTSSVASPPSSPPSSCGWSICPHLGALISHIFPHHISPARRVLLRHSVICNPAALAPCGFPSLPACPNFCISCCQQTHLAPTASPPGALFPSTSCGLCPGCQQCELLTRSAC